jgi:aryl-alcohol dehydrogenase-like predicted oxidoreductase
VVATGCSETFEILCRKRNARPMPADTKPFLQGHLRTIDKPVHRLGLAFNFGIEPGGIEAALERGVNYLFWTSAGTGHARASVSEALRKDRDRYVLAAGPSLGFFGGNIRRGTERLLKKMNVDRIDVLHLFWLGRMSAWTAATRDALAQLKDEGKIGAVGVSIHDRERAGRLASDPMIDLLMIRYNAAHPGAERDIFPHLDERNPNVVAYTATRWRKLLKAPRGWDGKVMTAADCYRFCLSNPHVDVTLCGPKTGAQLQANLDALERGPASDEELQWMRSFGRAVHG